MTTTYTKINKASGTSFTKISPPGSARYGYGKYGTAKYGDNGGTYTNIAKPVGVIDSYVQNNDTVEITLNPVLGFEGAGQSFTAVASTLYSSKFYLRKVGSITGALVSKLYSISGTYGTDSIPTGAALATSQSLNISSLPTNTRTLTEFLFTTPINLTAKSNYVITIEDSGLIGDALSYVSVEGDSDILTHSGNLTYKSGGIWVALVYDLLFYVNGSVSWTNITKAT